MKSKPCLGKYVNFQIILITHWVMQKNRTKLRSIVSVRCKAVSTVRSAATPKSTIAHNRYDEPFTQQQPPKRALSPL